MPFPLAPHHVQLIAACYPPSAALLTAGPDYKPNSQELSRLTYYASNRPGKITKLGSELEKRALSDARKASSGNMRARASLLITLNIFKALIQECRRDLIMLSTSLMAALDSTLTLIHNDVEIAAKVASVFAAWATYTNGQLLGIDQELTRHYLATLSRFSSMCLFKAKDTEDRNRMRIIGLSALTGAVASEALYGSSSQFKSQASTIVPALFINLLQVDLLVLDHESQNNRDSPPLTTFLADFRTRPLLERRAASIHVHIDGEEGPTHRDVANAAVKALACLLSQSNAAQVTHALQAVLDGLGVYDGWKHTEHCCWFIRKAIEWTQYQYRFAIPTRLLDKLMEAQEDARPSDLHKTLVAMIRATFTASVPLVNVSTSDVCSNLTALILRRIAINPDDELLPDLVSCVGALGTHIYYADQIHDLACEIIGRLTHIENNGINGLGRLPGPADEGRAMALRCLIACIGLLIRSDTRTSHGRATSMGSCADHELRGAGLAGGSPESSRGDSVNPRTSNDATSLRIGLPHRSRIPPDVWQDTLSLLCEDNFAVRSDYARVLALYLRSEIRPEMGTRVAAGGVDRSSSSNAREGGRSRYVLGGKSGTKSVGSTSRFLHALMASLYILATSLELDIPSSSPPSPDHYSDDEHEQEQGQRQDPVSVSITPSTPLPGQSFSGDQDEPISEGSLPWQYSRRKSFGLTVQTRKFHRIRRLLDATVHQGSHPLQSDVEGSSACLSDYVHILHILNIVHEQTPARALLTSLPMLLALRSWCDADSSPQHRRAAIRQVLTGQWQTISQIWDIAELTELTKNDTLSPCFPYPPPEIEFPSSEPPSSLSSLIVQGRELASWCGDEVVVLAISRNAHVQSGIGFDEDSLAERLGSSWTPENALRDAVEASTNDESPRLDHSNPLLKISPALMHVSNLSLQSLTRSNRGVGVNDLRDALEGRGAASSLALSQARAPSVASLGATHSGASGESAVSPSVWSVSRPRQRLVSGESSKDVKNVLDKLGIGSNKTATSPKMPSPVRETRRATRSVLVPPYKG